MSLALYTSRACHIIFTVAQMIDNLHGICVNGLCDMRYLHYCNGANVRRTKMLMHDVLTKQKQAISRLLKSATGNEELTELIGPVLDIMEDLLPANAEIRHLEKDLESQVGLGVVVHARSLGQVGQQVKVRVSLESCANAEEICAQQRCIRYIAPYD